MQPIKKFQQTIEIQHYSNATKKAYGYYIDNFVKFCCGDLRKENIIRYLHYLSVKEFSPTTINIARASVLYLFNKVLNQEIDSKEIPTIKRKKSLPNPVDREVIIKLIQNTKNIKHRILIELLYSSGMRLSEVVNVRWDNLDFMKNTIRINNGKGNKDRLSILSNIVINHLLDYKEMRKNKESEYVFDSQARPYTHISKKTVQKVLQTASIKSELGFMVTPHMMRHSFATHTLEDGTDIREIQDMLGHSSPKTTMIYTKVTKKNLSKIINPLDKLYEKVDLTRKKGIKRSKKVDQEGR